MLGGADVASGDRRFTSALPPSSICRRRRPSVLQRSAFCAAVTSRMAAAVSPGAREDDRTEPPRSDSRSHPRRALAVVRPLAGARRSCHTLSVELLQGGQTHNVASAPAPLPGIYGVARESERRRRNMEDENAVLTAEEAAQLLHVSTKTLLRLARDGELPGRKIGREWRFARQELLRLLAPKAEVAS